MLSIMERIAKFLMCNILIYTKKANTTQELAELFSVSVTRLDKLKPIVDYFNKYPLLGIKGKDFQDWVVVYHMLVSKEHLTEAGRLKIVAPGVFTQKIINGIYLPLLNCIIQF